MFGSELSVRIVPIFFVYERDVPEHVRLPAVMPIIFNILFYLKPPNILTIFNKLFLVKNLVVSEDLLY